VFVSATADTESVAVMPVSNGTEGTSLVVDGLEEHDVVENGCSVPVWGSFKDINSDKPPKRTCVWIIPF
jgi:hypothetical protein